MNFRYDINALRCIAVLMVVIFHMNSTFLPNGFMGVDIFFVISGYLMTRIIIKRINDNNFHIFEFYSSRAYRIIPPLTVLCILLFVFFYIFETPESLEQLGFQSITSLLFISNIYYWTQSGYFDVAAPDNWLLHTWSLSAEWQFYIIYPVIIIALKKITGNNSDKFKIIMIFLVIFLYTFSSILSNIYPDFSYYNFPSRAWQMMLGSLAYLYPFPRSNKIKLSSLALSIILLLISIFLIDTSSDGWPGWVSLFPCAFALLFISSDLPKNRFTSNRIVSVIGKSSYSIYLWHWPIIVANESFNINLSSYALFVIIIIWSLIFYFLVEVLLNRKVFQPLWLFGFLLALSQVISNGYLSRVEHEYQLDKTEYAKLNHGAYGYEKNGVIDLLPSQEGYDWILYGDSFARQYSRAFVDLNINSLGVFYGGCMSFNETYSLWKNNSKYKDGCKQIYNELIRLISENKKSNIIIAQNWRAYSNIIVNRDNDQHVESFYHTIEKEILNLRETLPKERKIYIFNSSLYNERRNNQYRCLVSKSLLGYPLLSRHCDYSVDRKIAIYNSHDKINEVLFRISESNEGIYYFDVNDVFCDEDECSMLNIENRLIHSDRYHLSFFGAKEVINVFFGRNLHSNNK